MNLTQADRAGHTPGPWFTKREGFSTVYVETRIGGGLIQEVAACGPTQGGTDEQAANARLIAAAPELLVELEKLVKVAGRLGASCAGAKNIIANAKGGAA